MTAVARTWQNYFQSNNSREILYVNDKHNRHRCRKYAHGYSDKADTGLYIY